mgnify:CR=1 FL=1
MDDILRGVHAVLCADPSVGAETSNPRIKALAASPWGGEGFVIYYSILDDDTVVLESIIEAIEQ